jgi:hypothetical protein
MSGSCRHCEERLLATKQSRAAASLAPLWIATPQARLAMTSLDHRVSVLRGLGGIRTRA